MGSDNVVQVSIRGDASSLSSATKEAGSAMGGLTGALKEWRTHVRTEARYTNFMAAQIAGLGVASKGAAAELTGLVAGFAFGSWTGLAVESLKLIVHQFQALGEAEAAANEELKKWGEDLEAGTARIRRQAEITAMVAAGASKAQIAAYEEIRPLQDEAAALEKKINDAALKVVETREKGNGQLIEASSKLAEIDEAELARMRTRLDLLNKTITARQLARGSEATIGIRADTAKELADDAKLYVQKEKLRVDHLMRVSKAEFDSAKSLEKMHADQLAQRVQIDENFGKIEDAERDRLDRAAKERFRELKDEIHEAMAEGTKFGHVFGDAFAGIATGTLSVTKAFANMGQAIVRVIFDQVRKAIEAYALQAAAAAAAANAGFPFIGLAMAAAAAAAMEGMVLGLLSSLPSAAVGMPYVPADMPVMVHRNEAILTSGQADDWRVGRGGGGGGGGGIGEVHVHIHSPFADAFGLRNFLASDEFTRAFHEAVRNGHINR